MRFTNFTEQHLETLYNAYKTKEYPEYFRHFSDFLNKEQLLAELICYGSLTAIEDDEGNMIGHITALIYRKPKIASLGLLILKEHQKKQYAYKAILKLLDYLYTDGIRRVTATISAKDERSNTLLKKGGFTYEGKLIKSCFYNNQYVNEHRYSLSREKYTKLYKGKE